MPTTVSAPSIATPPYDSVARMLHWLMACLILAVFLLGLLVDTFPKTWEHGIVETHKVLGVGILLLVAVRFAWRLVHRPPASEHVSPLLDRAAWLGHYGLYALMLAVPVIGLVYTALRGQGIDFGLFSIPPIMERNRELGRTVREVHELAAFALIGLASIHALLALWHHFIRKDTTLLRMLPVKR
ncbi:cytochrome b [Bosea sp. 685]|uniref:cytochrome b n=1 Tax=Bosea sp. 685 TaxID=3080057 RepID=UPI00289380E9|nr:cytochrome b [Bosea sp. 685]WNJ93509.1 cytochrome b [Bosea sp. 685]